MTILITGGCGFIGSNFIIDWFANESEKVVNLDKLTYAGNPNNLSSLDLSENYFFAMGDIADRVLLRKILESEKPRCIINFAAESHVDRSISGPEPFITTNIVGTYNLLEEARSYWNSLDAQKKDQFRFIHISTDEVYGSLGPNDPPFSETHKYEPNSVYSASKASSDHLVRAYYATYGLPVITTNCSNNYGPYQFPEKLIPLVIHNAISKLEIPLYGDGLNVRDWLYVSDHCSAIRTVLKSGKVGETYNIGGINEKTNIEIVNTICEILDEISPRHDSVSYKKQIVFVKDRAGHDRRYAINSSKIEKELHWTPSKKFEEGIRETITWYLHNKHWVSAIIDGSYRNLPVKRFAV